VVPEGDGVELPGEYLGDEGSDVVGATPVATPRYTESRCEQESLASTKVGCNSLGSCFENAIVNELSQKKTQFYAWLKFAKYKISIEMTIIRDVRQDLKMLTSDCDNNEVNEQHKLLEYHQTFPLPDINNCLDKSVSYLNSKAHMQQCTELNEHSLD